MRHILIVLIALLGVPALAQDRSLPDPLVFRKEVRQRLQTDERRQSGYMYRETRIGL